MTCLCMEESNFQGFIHSFFSDDFQDISVKPAGETSDLG